MSLVFFDHQSVEPYCKALLFVFSYRLIPLQEKLSSVFKLKVFSNNQVICTIFHKIVELLLKKA